MGQLVLTQGQLKSHQRTLKTHHIIIIYKYVKLPPLLEIIKSRKSTLTEKRIQQSGRALLSLGHSGMGTRMP